MEKRFYEDYIKVWLPIFKRQIFKAKVNNDTETLFDIQLNIWKNWNMNENQKKGLLKELGLSKIKV